MKNKTLLYILAAGGIIYLISRQKGSKNKKYSLEVPEPTKITKEQFEGKTLLQKVTPIAKKVITKVKQNIAKKKAAKKVGYFPATF